MQYFLKICDNRDKQLSQFINDQLYQNKYHTLNLQIESKLMEKPQSNEQLFFYIDEGIAQMLNKAEIQADCQFFIRVKVEQAQKSAKRVSKGHSYKNQQVFLQIRQDYVLQYDSDSKKFISAFKCDPQHRFQILRAANIDNNSAGKQFGITFKLQGKLEQPINLYIQQQEEYILKLIHFSAALQKKYLIQEGFHKIYKAIRRVGKGASACVYASLRLTDQVQVAIKSFKKESYFALEGGRGKVCFEKEFKIMTQLRNKYLIQLLAVFQSDNSVYLVMELLSRNLLAYIQKFNFPEYNQCRKMMFKLVYGLAFMHSKGIMHRDLKLENIMIRGEGKDNIEPVIVDMGLAEYVGNEEPLFIRCGTPGYVAPEIINMHAGEKKMNYSQACDVFSLGVIFHILLLGRAVFEGENMKEIVNKNKQCDIDYEFSKFPALTPAIKDILRKMLEKAPNQRISAKQLLNHQFFEDIRSEMEAECPNIINQA